MGEIKKILIIDDSALMRSVESDIIRKDGRYVVENEASDGMEGLDLLIRNNGKYDVVLLDVNMPRMDGLEVLDKIERYHLKCKVIMVSTLVKEGSRETIMALEKGAVDVVLKPSVDVRGKAIDDFGNNILKAIEAAVMSKEKVLPKKTENGSANNLDAIRSKLKTRLSDVKEAVRKPSTGSNEKTLVAIACSTGGPKILRNVMEGFNKKIDAPIVIVQHMPKGFTKSLAERLNEFSEIEVTEAVDGQVLEKSHMYVAPGGSQMRIVDGENGSLKILITDEAPRDGLKPCANIMFESIAECKVDKVVCAVLTGMGSDGRIGVDKIKKSKKTYVIAQDEMTCIVYGMPRAIVSAGLADVVLPHDKIADEIIKNVGVLNNGC